MDDTLQEIYVTTTQKEDNELYTFLQLRVALVGPGL